MLYQKHKPMRKTSVAFSLLAAVLLASCKNNEPVKPATPPATPPPVENPAPPPPPKPRVETPVKATVTPKPAAQVRTTEERDGTSVNISSDGLDIKSKNGDNENNVTISSKKKSSIQIKTN